MDRGKGGGESGLWVLNGDIENLSRLVEARNFR